MYYINLQRLLIVSQMCLHYHYIYIYTVVTNLQQDTFRKKPQIGSIYRICESLGSEISVLAPDRMSHKVKDVLDLRSMAIARWRNLESMHGLNPYKMGRPGKRRFTW